MSLQALTVEKGIVIMKGTIELYTDRLVLRRYKMEDAAALHRFFGIDEKMYEYSGWNPYATEEMADSAVKQFIDSYRDPSFYGWAVELKKDPGSAPETACELHSTRKRVSQEGPDGAKAAEGFGTENENMHCALIGTVGAYDYDPEAGTIEVGLSIRPDCQGMGLGTEALSRVLAYLTEEEKIPCVTAWCAGPNMGSRKAMEKAGMKQSAFEADALEIKDRVFDKLTYEYRLPVDLTFRTRCGTFNYRVGAVIIHDGKYLLMKNDEEPYYYTVGGRVRFDETTEETVLREVEEEIGVKLEIDRFLFFQEQFFDGKVTGTHIHELGVYYLMKDSPLLENLTCRSVTARGVAEELCWIPAGEIGNHYIVPESISARLASLPLHPEHIIEIDER